LGVLPVGVDERRHPERVESRSLVAREVEFDRGEVVLKLFVAVGADDE
jgi:hypothetical protein